MTDEPARPAGSVLVTGMSGTGKSTVLAELGRRGHRVVDTDYGGWSEDVAGPGDGDRQRLWRADRISGLLAEHRDGLLFVSGCVANQGVFYDRFAAVVLLSAPVEVMLGRLSSRTTNAFGKSAHERRRILADLAEVEPLLRAGATVELDTDREVDEVVDAVEAAAVLSVAWPNVCHAPPTRGGTP